MIPVFKPNYDQREIDAVTEVLKSGWIGLGPKTEEFEKAFAKYIGCKYAVALNSCTSALQLTLKVAGIEEGDEVITTPMTFVSTNMAILYNKAIPVFCDIEEDTLNIDVRRIESLITAKTKAIIVVHFGGYACDMEALTNIADKYNIKIIEDVAHGCGGGWAMIDNLEKEISLSYKLGSIGDIGCFSFHAVKNLAVGDGGMITTNDIHVYERLLKLRWLGIDKDTYKRSEGSYAWQYNVLELGYKMHMSDISAALGLVQLNKLDDGNKRRKEIVTMYNRALGVDIQTPILKSYQIPSYHNYVIQCQDRDDLHEFLKSKGISTGVHYTPNNHYNLFKDFKGKTPVADRVFKNILTLPLYPDLKNEEVEYIIQKIHEWQF